MNVAHAARAAVDAAGFACVAEGAPAKTKVAEQAPPQSPEALYNYCRIAVFRKMGAHTGDGRLAMYPNTLVQQTDYCVANHGKIWATAADQVPPQLVYMERLEAASP